MALQTAFHRNFTVGMYRLPREIDTAQTAVQQKTNWHTCKQIVPGLAFLRPHENMGMRLYVVLMNGLKFACLLTTHFHKDHVEGYTKGQYQHYW